MAGPYEYDVALSYADEDRAYVERVAAALQRQGIRLFFDRYRRASLWGQDLSVHLDEVYRRRSRFVVMFVSAHYARKAWPRRERQSALARALEEHGDFLLPARFDDTDVPGLLPTIGYVDCREHTAEQLAALIVEKLGGRAPQPAPPVVEARPRADLPEVVRECADACEAACDPPRLQGSRLALREWMRRRGPVAELAGIREDLGQCRRELARAVAWIERQQGALLAADVGSAAVADRLSDALDRAHRSASTLAEQARTLETEVVPALRVAAPAADGGRAVSERALRTLEEMEDRAAADEAAMREALRALTEQLAHP